MSNAQQVGWYELNSHLPDWLIFPEDEWKTIDPEDAGLDPVSFQAWVQSVRNQQPDRGGYAGDRPDGWGIAITRAGYLLHTFGDPAFKYQVASTGKLFTDFALIIAVDQGKIGSLDDPIKDYWTGVNELSHPHKYLNHGHHQKLTWRHLSEHTGGFPVTNGQWWKMGNYGLDTPAPAWSHCTSDPDFDNYAHAEPGAVGMHYSSGGRWRLSQALTAVWQRDLKSVLDEFMLSKIGIQPDDWDWLAGEDVRNNPDFYKELPAYAHFCDPPYSLNGHRVLGGGGWVVMNALQLARVGLLMSTGGIWKNERVLSQIPGFRRGQAIGHDGGGGSRLFCWPAANGKEAYISYGQVTTSPEWTLMPDPWSNTVAGWIVGTVKSI